MTLECSVSVAGQSAEVYVSSFRRRSSPFSKIPKLGHIKGETQRQVSAEAARLKCDKTVRSAASSSGLRAPPEMSGSKVRMLPFQSFGARIGRIGSSMIKAGFVLCSSCRRGETG